MLKKLDSCTVFVVIKSFKKVMCRYLFYKLAFLGLQSVSILRQVIFDGLYCIHTNARLTISFQ